MPVSASVTLNSLAKQTRKAYRVILQPDHGHGAAWVRNEGFKQVDTEYVLFSDDDINWRPEAIETLTKTLRAHPEAAFAYCAYRSNWRGPELHTISWQHWDPALLRLQNYISSMSLWRAVDFPGFDETLRRYQDWDIYLTVSEQGKRGVFCGKLLFDTRLRPDGVTWGSIPITEAREIIRRKHNL